jgi:pyruvate-formate lyase-activating enzyme
MKINNVQFPVFNPYSKPTYEIYVAGCLNACPECHLKELWDFDNGEEVTDEFFKKMEDRREWFECIGILGGDLLAYSNEEVFKFGHELNIRFYDKEKWLFTGYK